MSFCQTGIKDNEHFWLHCSGHTGERDHVSNVVDMDSVKVTQKRPIDPSKAIVFQSYYRVFPCVSLIRIVRTELKNGKAPGIDNIYNIILKKAIGTGFYKVLARAFTISLKLGFIPHVWKIAVLCMLIKPDKPPSQATSYRPISLLSAIMKLFEWVIEKRLRKHLEDYSFFSKYQSGFRKSKSTNDYLFRLSQTIMESFSRGEHVTAAS